MTDKSYITQLKKLVRRDVHMVRGVCIDLAAHAFIVHESLRFVNPFSSRGRNLSSRGRYTIFGGKRKSRVAALLNFIKRI